jgi:hypothetical protein
MASVVGHSGAVQVKGTTTVLKIVSWEVTPTAEMLDDTGMSDGGVGAYLSGITRWTCRFEAKFQTAQTPFVTLAITPGLSMAVRFDTDASPSQRLSGTCLVSSIPIRTEVNGQVTWSVEGQGTGILTYA